MKKKMKTILTALTFALAAMSTNAQISILNTNLSTLNITPESLCQVNIMNGNANEMQVSLEAKLLNSAGENILLVKTNPFRLNAGMNNGFNLNYTIQSTIYGSSAQAQYIQTTHTLPSGNFKYCISIVALNDEAGDDYCEDLVSDITSFLSLVYPYDKDTIDTPNPLLSWTHSEPFNILATGEYFRLIVVELNSDQSAESGVSTNNPIYYKNYVSSHQQLYPVDAKELEEGKRYGWQVQKMSNGTVIDKTEAWEFTLRKKAEIAENKYAILKKKLDAGFYTTENNKVFFRFNEDYTGGILSCKIRDDKRNVLKPVVKNETDKSKTATGEKMNIKTNGVNLFEIDLSQFDVKEGYYELEVLNSKKQKYFLKIYVK